MYPLAIRTLRLAALGVGLALPAAVDAAESVRVGGTGMAIAVMQEIAQLVASANPPVQLDVLPSLGTKGGLQALSDGVVGIATAARPLTDKERSAGLAEAACADTPLVFASSRPDTKGVRRQDLPLLFSDPRATWPDGTPVRPIMRSRSGSEMPYLASKDPALGPSFQAAYARPGIAVGATDQENADLAKRIEGSLAVLTLLQIRSEAIAVNVLPLDGVAPSAESLADGSYPFAMTLCLVLPAKPTAAALAVVDAVKSRAGRDLFRHYGAHTAN